MKNVVHIDSKSSLYNAVLHCSSLALKVNMWHTRYFYWTALVSGVTLSWLEGISDWNLVNSLSQERNNNQKIITNVYYVFTMYQVLF